MLLVNGFRPIQKTYTNQNPNKSNLRKSHFQSKADSVHFTSLVPEATKATEEADAQVAELTQKYLKEHSDIFGPNFEEKFLKPVNEFLNQHGISIKHKPIDYLEVETRFLIEEKVNNASHSHLVDRNGLATHLDAVLAVTANAATTRIFDKLINDEISFFNGKNPFKGKKFPEELVAMSNRVNDELGNFLDKWTWINYGDEDDKKVKSLQEAFKILMPEK